MAIQMVLTSEEAIKEIQKRRKIKVYYGVWVRPFLPTTDDRGFEGCSIARVSKKEFIHVLQDLLRNLEERGAKITLWVPDKDYEGFLI